MPQSNRVPKPSEPSALTSSSSDALARCRLPRIKPSKAEYQIFNCFSFKREIPIIKRGKKMLKLSDQKKNSKFFLGSKT